MKDIDEIRDRSDINNNENFASIDKSKNISWFAYDILIKLDFLKLDEDIGNILDIDNLENKVE